jgi:hypothetical protein
MRIVVPGLVASFPLGGAAWDYLAYVDGFRRLGCDVLYLEDVGKPVVQDTGWSTYYPTGAGRFAFDTPDEALVALETANGDYRRQCDAARAVAESAFAADKVLERLLADCDLT